MSSKVPLIKFMPDLYRSRYTILSAVVFFYLLPVVLLSNYGRSYMPSQIAWNFLAFGLFSCALGTACLFWMVCKWSQPAENKLEVTDTEDAVEEEVSHISKEESLVPSAEWDEMKRQLIASQEQISLLQNELDRKNEDFSSLQNEYQILQDKQQILLNEQEDHKKVLLQELETQKKLLAQSQNTIAEQREGIDKKLQQIAQLEMKVSDLTYEIKTLIQLAEIENQSMPIYPTLPIENSPSTIVTELDDEMPYHPEKQVRNETQAAIQLKKCIDSAQKITGASHYNNVNSRFKELGVDNYTLDLRRLFDNLRMENQAAIVFYSRKDNKIIFINNQSRNLLGWSPDKFVQSFNDIVEPSKEIWKQGINNLAIKNDVHIHLKMKSKAGPSVEVQALLGIIPTGIFRHHILGVLYQNITS